MAIFGTGGEEFDDERTDPLRQQEIENLLLWEVQQKREKRREFLTCTVSWCPLVCETYGRSKNKKNVEQ